MIATDVKANDGAPAALEVETGHSHLEDLEAETNDATWMFESKLAMVT